jgi:hypothetical protein
MPFPTGIRCGREPRLGKRANSVYQAEAVGTTTMMARVAEPEEMANVIVLLAPPDAS